MEETAEMKIKRTEPLKRKIERAYDNQPNWVISEVLATCLANHLFNSSDVQIIVNENVKKACETMTKALSEIMESKLGCESNIKIEMKILTGNKNV